MKNKKMLFMIINGVIAILCLIGVYYTFLSMGVEIDPETNQALGDTAMVDTAMTFTLWFTNVSLFLIGGFTIWAIIDNPKRFIPTFIGLAVFALVFFISYGSAGVEAEGTAIWKIPTATETWVKWSGVGIIMTYILVFMAIALLVIQMIRNVVSFLQK